MIAVDNMKYVVDVFLIIFLITGIVFGWRRGFITSLVSFLFTVCVFVGAFYLKNFVSPFLYEYLPFFDYGGLFKDITALNILVYEGLAFVICIIVLVLIVMLITKLTDFVNKLVNATVILALPNKILGSILTFVQFFIISYFVLFICIQIPYTNYVLGLNTSKVAEVLVNKTPGLSLITKKYYDTYNEVYDVIDKYANASDRSNANYETLEVLMKNKMVKTESVKKVKDKLNINNIDELINKYNE